MYKILMKKKNIVIKRLIQKLGHTNRDDIESSLNASAVLIELVEQKQTLPLFLKNRGEHLSTIMELAIDPSNQFNQPYLMLVLLSITKRLRPQTPSAANMFNSLDEDIQTNTKPRNYAGVTIPGWLMGFDPENKEQQRAHEVLDFLGVVREQELIYNLLLILCTNDIKFKGSLQSHFDHSPDQEYSKIYITNQQGHKVKKIGLTRLRALELLQNILQLMFPSFSKMVVTAVKLKM